MIPFKPTDFEPRRYQPVEPLERPSFLTRELDRPVMRALHKLLWACVAIVACLLAWFHFSQASAPAQPASSASIHTTSERAEAPLVTEASR